MIKLTEEGAQAAKLVVTHLNLSTSGLRPTDVIPAKHGQNPSKQRVQTSSSLRGEEDQADGATHTDMSAACARDTLDKGGAGQLDGLSPVNMKWKIMAMEYMSTWQENAKEGSSTASTHHPPPTTLQPVPRTLALHDVIKDNQPYYTRKLRGQTAVRWGVRWGAKRYLLGADVVEAENLGSHVGLVFLRIFSHVECFAKPEGRHLYGAPAERNNNNKECTALNPSVAARHTTRQGSRAREACHLQLVIACQDESGGLQLPVDDLHSPPTVVNGSQPPSTAASRRQHGAIEHPKKQTSASKTRRNNPHVSK